MTPPPDQGDPGGRGAHPAHGAATPLLIGVVILLALAWGRDVVIPLALAMLLSFVLAPLVTRLRRLGLPRPPAVLLVVVAALGLIGGFATVLTNQAIDLAGNLPRYESNLRDKVHAIGASGGLLERTADLLRRIGDEAASAGDAVPGATTAPRGSPGRPLLVQMEEPGTPLASILEAAAIVLAPLATVGLVVLFVVFLLLQREDLRDRMLRLFGTRDVHRATAAMNDAAKRLSRYLAAQLIVNLAFGLSFGAGLWLVGVPNALLWGLLGTVLRFIPYIGTIIALVFPLTLATAIAPGWSLPVLVVALFLGIELLVTYALEPWLFSASTGLSSVAVVVAAMFWTILWGPVGLLLSTPLTACLAVLGRHVPQLEFLAVLLGNEPALADDVRFYQRLLADDPEEAAELAESRLDEATLVQVYDTVMVPALVMAAADRRRGALDRAGKRSLADDVRDIARTIAALAEPDPLPEPTGPAVLCVGLRSTLDDAAASMLAHLLRHDGRNGELVEGDRLPSLELDAGAVGMAVLVSVEAGSATYVRRAVRRLRARQGDDLPVVVALLGGQETGEVAARLERVDLVGRLASAVAAVPRPDDPARPAGPTAGAAPEPPPLPGSPALPAPA